MKAVPLAARLPAGFFLAAPLLALALALAPAQAQAQGPRLSGYGTLGAVHVDAPAGWRFLRDITQRRDADRGTHLGPDTRVGLQANWPLGERWELVAQLVGRERARSAPPGESLEWAFLAWRPAPQWQLRLGRTSPDLFLLADYRNVGFAYPWVRPPVEHYGWMPFHAMDGAELEGRFAHDDARWKARLFAGRTRATMASGSDRPDPVTRSPRLYGATLSREAGAWTVKATAAYAWSTVTDTVGLAGLRDALLQVGAAGLPRVSAEAAALGASIALDGFSTRYVSLGFTWEQGPWALQGEWTRIGGSYRAHNARFGYLSVARRQGPFTLFALGGLARPAEPALADPQWGAQAAPFTGPALAAQVQALGTATAGLHNLARHDQHSLAAGLRWDVHASLAWKLQVDRVRIAPHGAALWSSSSGAQAAQGARATLLSTSLDWVF